MKIIRSYSELIRIPSFEDRIRYLELNGRIGSETFGGHRTMNQRLYTSPRWRSLRNEIILRDNGMDLAHEDYEIAGPVYIHHLNPITIDDLLEMRSVVFDPENLVSVSYQTHAQIHYGIQLLQSHVIVERIQGDTCPWR